MDSNENEKEFLNETEVAKLLCISVDTIRGWRKTKYRAANLPFVKIGKLVRYKRSDLEEYINKNRK